MKQKLFSFLIASACFSCLMVAAMEKPDAKVFHPNGTKMLMGNLVAFKADTDKRVLWMLQFRKEQLSDQDLENIEETRLGIENWCKTCGSSRDEGDIRLKLQKLILLCQIKTPEQRKASINCGLRLLIKSKKETLSREVFNLFKAMELNNAEVDSVLKALYKWEEKTVKSGKEPTTSMLKRLQSVDAFRVQLLTLSDQSERSCEYSEAELNAIRET